LNIINHRLKKCRKGRRTCRRCRRLFTSPKVLATSTSVSQSLPIRILLLNFPLCKSFREASDFQVRKTFIKPEIDKTNITVFVFFHEFKSKNFHKSNMVASKQKHHDHYAERRPSKSQTDQLPVYVLKSKRRKTRKSVAPGDPSGTTLGSLKNDSSGGIINNNSSFQPPPPSETAVKDGSGGGGRGGCCAGCCCSCCKDTGETKDTRYRLQGIVLPFFIRYLARFSHIWEILIYMMVVASFGVVTYVAFFALFEDYLWTFIAVSDVIFNIGKFDGLN